MVAATAVVSWVVVASVAVETEAAARVAPGRGQGTGVKGASRVGRVDGRQLGGDRGDGDGGSTQEVRGRRGRARGTEREGEERQGGKIPAASRSSPSRWQSA